MSQKKILAIIICCTPHNIDSKHIVIGKNWISYEYIIHFSQLFTVANTEQLLFIEMINRARIPARFYFSAYGLHRNDNIDWPQILNYFCAGKSLFKGAASLENHRERYCTPRNREIITIIPSNKRKIFAITTMLNILHIFLCAYATIFKHIGTIKITIILTFNNKTE